MAAGECPLRSWGPYWAGEDTLPRFCEEHCEALGMAASDNDTAMVDVLNPDCNHDVEFDDWALRRGSDVSSAKRLFSVLNVCAVDGTEAFSETWEFDCPHN